MSPAPARLRPLLAAAGPALALAAIVLAFGVADYWQDGRATFLTARNARVTLAASLPVAVAALGMTAVIAAGGIDLSAGTMLALCAVVTAWALKESEGGPAWPAWLAAAAAVLCGAACGAFNGVLVAGLRVVPFVVTLGTLGAYQGLAKLIADETTVRPDRDAVPAWLGTLTSVRPDALLFGLPPGAWALLGLAAAVAAVLKFTVFGRHLFAVGSNEKTARLCGVAVGRTTALVYALAGAMTGCAGVLQFSRLKAGNPTSGLGLELEVIAAVVIGGGSLAGGRGGVFGTLVGVAIVAAISSGGSQLGWSNPVQEIALGAIIVAAVAADRARARGG